MPIKTLNKALIYLLVAMLTVSGCKDSSQKSDAELFNIEVDTSGVYLQYRSTIFALPSPHQISLKLKMNDIEFNNSLLNQPVNYSNYTTTFKKAMNLGVYGTDLGYLNIYDRREEALTHYLVIEKLAKDLELNDAIDNNTLKQIERNLGQNDSILRIISNTYKRIDTYLTLNNRDAIGILILTGGWIESNYISTQILLKNYSPDLIQQVSKQKYPLEKLIRLLAPYYEQSNDFQDMIDMLTDLAYEFDCIDILYTYREPEVYPDKKLTIIKSQTELNLNNYNLAKIASKIANIRSKIVN